MIKVKPTKTFLKSHPIIEIGWILDNGNPWIYDTKTGTLKNSFERVIAKDKTLLSKKFVIEITKA